VEEKLKNRLFIISAGLCVVFLALTFASCNRANQIKLARDKEMKIRFDSQEKLEQTEREKAALEEKLKQSENALGKQGADLASVQKTLVQEQLINNSLKEELAKLNKLKEALEEDLKKAVVAGTAQKEKK
jgi:ABC-type phosphate/phosphonate transport system substrate-binding protein